MITRPRPGDGAVQCNLAGLDEPEPVGGPALLEQPVLVRQLDGPGVRGQPGDMLPGKPAQERVGTEDRLPWSAHVSSFVPGGTRARPAASASVRPG